MNNQLLRKGGDGEKTASRPYALLLERNEVYLFEFELKEYAACLSADQRIRGRPTWSKEQVGRSLFYTLDKI